MARLTRQLIDQENRDMLARQARFRVAADVVTDALSHFPEVEDIALIGSVARPLWKEVPRFSEFRRERIEIWHECKDVDLAAWISRLDRLHELNRARNLAANGIYDRFGFGIANHEVEVFLVEPATNRYLGRLCKYAQCPKGKLACAVPGCGQPVFLQQHKDFVLWPTTLNQDRMILLYNREAGILRRAADIPCIGLEPVDPPATSPSPASGASFAQRRPRR
jgi:hypothetical protein